MTKNKRQDAMLDPWVIEQIKKDEDGRRKKEEEDGPRIHPPGPDDYEEDPNKKPENSDDYEINPDKEPKKPEKKDRGVVIIGPDGEEKEDDESPDIIKINP